MHCSRLLQQISVAKVEKKAIKDILIRPYSPWNHLSSPKNPIMSSCTFDLITSSLTIVGAPLHDTAWSIRVCSLIETVGIDVAVIYPSNKPRVIADRGIRVIRLHEIARRIEVVEEDRGVALIGAREARNAAIVGVRHTIDFSEMFFTIIESEDGGDPAVSEVRAKSV